MAVIKASYTRSWGAAKAYVRYISHRPGKTGERITRELFGIDGRLTKEQAYQLIDRGGQGILFYRIALSPDPRKEDRLKDLDLREITEQTMMQLQAQVQERFKDHAIQFLAAIHADHTAIRHIHILALVPGKLGRKDLAAIRQAATAAAIQERQVRDHQQSQTRHHAPRRSYVRHTEQQASRERRHTSANRQIRPTCPNCGPWSVMDRRGRYFECPTCGLAVDRSFSPVRGIEQEGGLGLSLGEGGAL